MKILAIGAHPDDIELGAGGTLAKHASDKDQVYGLIVTNGQKLSGNRKDEATTSSKILGFKKLFFGNLNDTEVTDSVETISLIEDIVSKINPDRIYSHTIKDSHQDHRNVGRAALSACRDPKVKEILLYMSPWRQVDFQPRIFINISDFMKAKLKSLKTFSSQNGKKYMQGAAVRGLAMYWGYFINVKYAECFEIERWIED